MEVLIDGDLASNNGGLQWSASTGVDPAPYFRIFNPYTQSQKVSWAIVQKALYADLYTFRPTPGESIFEHSCQNSLKLEVKVGGYTYISMQMGY